MSDPSADAIDLPDFPSEGCRLIDYYRAVNDLLIKYGPRAVLVNDAGANNISTWIEPNKKAGK